MTDDSLPPLPADLTCLVARLREVADELRALDATLIDAPRGRSLYREAAAALEAQAAEVARSNAALQAQDLELSDLRAERDALREDAARWRHAWQCVRMANHGGFVIFPDEPTGLREDSMARAAFIREIDAARAAQPKEGK